MLFSTTWIESCADHFQFSSHHCAEIAAFWHMTLITVHTFQLHHDRRAVQELLNQGRDFMQLVAPPCTHSVYSDISCFRHNLDASASTTRWLSNRITWQPPWRKRLAPANVFLHATTNSTYSTWCPWHHDQEMTAVHTFYSTFVSTISTPLGYQIRHI